MIDDPLLGSWLQRTLPAAAADDRGRSRRERVEQFAGACLLHPSPHVCAGEPVGADPAMRTSRSVHAVALMRRALAAARSDAARAEAAGQPAPALSLRLDTLAALEAETWGAFLMSFLLVDLLARMEAGEIDAQQRALLRLATPLAALVTARQAAVVTGELATGPVAASPPVRVDESVELAIDALSQAGQQDALAVLMGRASSCLRSIKEPRLLAAGRQAVGALERAALWLESGKEHDVLAAGARRLALTLARGLQLALLCEHAQWMIDHRGDRRGFAAALRYSRLPVDLIHEVDPGLDRVLLGF
jgi:hypothetical protein